MYKKREKRIKEGIYRVYTRELTGGSLPFCGGVYRYTPIHQKNDNFGFDTYRIMLSSSKRALARSVEDVFTRLSISFYTVVSWMLVHVVHCKDNKCCNRPPSYSRCYMY